MEPKWGNLSIRSRLINSLIDHDLETYYEDGFPYAQKMVYENPLGEYRAYYNGARPVTILQHGFLQYLNEQVEDLENIEQIDDVLRFSRANELGGRESKTWIVAVDFLKYHTRSFMLVERVENGPYKQISNILPSFSSRYYEDGESEAIVAYDLTGDGINEIIIHNETYLGGNATDQMLHIYTWTGDRLEKLESLDLHYYDSYYFAPKYEFGDFIKDETVDIQILQNHASNFGCAWEEENTYSWNGLQPQHELADGFPQGSAVCNLWRVA
ncbi:MAG: hypothetical protein IPJ94_07875 [Chloroflexi bacterium]|nr:hypothetical protein [Chloroflexota bacterium]